MIKILDATIRDGGLVNDFRFTDDFVRNVYIANAEAGVDYMEFGYRADKKQFSPADFGKWKFASDEDIRSIVTSCGELRHRPKISVMADVGRCDYQNDIHPKAESPVDMIRIATYIDTIPEAIKMIEDAAAKGYETTCNIMAISCCSDEQIAEALKALATTPVQGVYIVDSYGALYPKCTRHLTDLYTSILKPAGKMTGIHTHNNQQCAFANTIEAMDCGAELLDATIYGMGRGAGNCHLEQLVGYLRSSQYVIEPLLKLVSEEMLPLQDTGTIWGYNTSFLLTGLANKHPRTAIKATKEKDFCFVEQFTELCGK